jgi:DNA-binding response OmpR family regulator
VTRGSIVIVEDDENVAQLLGFMLRREGFEPQLLGDGRAAEEYIATHEPPAAVVLDIMLPYRDGFAVAAAIRADERWKRVPIVALTARSLPSDLERARGLGVSDYVVKPFHPRALVGRISGLLGPAAP